jgi:hypothetical protein
MRLRSAQVGGNQRGGDTQNRPDPSAEESTASQLIGGISFTPFLSKMTAL